MTFEEICAEYDRVRTLWLQTGADMVRLRREREALCEHPKNWRGWRHDPDDWSSLVSECLMCEKIIDG